MEAALVLKKRGHTPIIYEKTDKLGGNFNHAPALPFKGCVKKFYDVLMPKAEEAKKNGGQTVKHLHFHLIGGVKLSEKMC